MHFYLALEHFKELILGKKDLTKVNILIGS